VRHRKAFLQLAEQLNQQLAVTDTLLGTNLSKGQEIQLFFYQHRARASGG
jgi:hypothetical protein